MQNYIVNRPCSFQREIYAKYLKANYWLFMSKSEYSILHGEAHYSVKKNKHV